MDALRYFQSCRFDGGLFDSGREAWQGGIGLRNQILPLKKSCVCGGQEEVGGRWRRRVEGGGWRDEARVGRRVKARETDVGVCVCEWEGRGVCVCEGMC